MANWGGLIPTIIGGIQGLTENLIGQSWEDDANKKEAALGGAPEFSTPQSQLEYEQLAKTQANQDMPGYADQVRQIEANSAYATASTARAAGSQYGAMAGSNAAQANRKKYLRQLGIGNDVYQSGAEERSIQATASRAPYEQMEFEYNEWLPWQIAKNEIASIRGTGQQQLIGGLDQAAAAGIQGANIYNQNRNYGDNSMLP